VGDFLASPPQRTRIDIFDSDSGELQSSFDSEAPIGITGVGDDSVARAKFSSTGKLFCAVGWRGETPAGQPVRLFESIWENPHPDDPITHLDYESAMQDSAHFIIAITVE